MFKIVKAPFVRLSLINALFIITVIGTASVTSVTAGEADVLKVKVKCKDSKKSQNKCHFSVRVQHKDTGWSHYADRWEILSLDGEILATRVLAHPHVDEQPFTRSITAEIPPKHKSVIVRAHDSEHGYGGKELTVILTKPALE